MGCTFCSLLYPLFSPLQVTGCCQQMKISADLPQTCCERSVMQWDHYCSLLSFCPVVSDLRQLVYAHLGSETPMYALVSLAIVCHIVLELAKHCWGIRVCFSDDMTNHLIVKEQREQLHGVTGYWHSRSCFTDERGHSNWGEIPALSSGWKYS